MNKIFRLRKLLFKVINKKIIFLMHKNLNYNTASNFEGGVKDDNI